MSDVGKQIDAAFREVDKAFEHVDEAFKKAGKAIDEEVKKAPKTGKVISLTWRNRWRLIRIAFSRAGSVRI